MPRKVEVVSHVAPEKQAQPVLVTPEPETPTFPEMGDLGEKPAAAENKAKKLGDTEYAVWVGKKLSGLFDTKAEITDHAKNFSMSDVSKLVVMQRVAFKATAVVEV